MKRIDFYTKTAFKAYCQEFAADCQSGKTDAIENEIKKVIPVTFKGQCRRIRKNHLLQWDQRTHHCNSVQVRQPPGSWRVGNAKDYYRPKIDQLRQVSLRGGRLPFEHKVDLALTLATVEHSRAVHA